MQPPFSDKIGRIEVTPIQKKRSAGSASCAKLFARTAARLLRRGYTGASVYTARAEQTNGGPRGGVGRQDRGFSCRPSRHAMRWEAAVAVAAAARFALEAFYYTKCVSTTLEEEMNKDKGGRKPAAWRNVYPTWLCVAGSIGSALLQAAAAATLIILFGGRTGPGSAEVRHATWPVCAAPHSTAPCHLPPVGGVVAMCHDKRVLVVSPLTSHVRSCGPRWRRV